MKVLLLIAYCEFQMLAQTPVVTDVQLKGRTIAEVHKLLGEPLHSTRIQTSLTNTHVLETWMLSPNDYLTVAFEHGKVRRLEHHVTTVFIKDPSAGGITPDRFVLTASQARQLQDSTKDLKEALGAQPSICLVGSETEALVVVVLLGPIAGIDPTVVIQVTAGGQTVKFRVEPGLNYYPATVKAAKQMIEWIKANRDHF